MYCVGHSPACTFLVLLQYIVMKTFFVTLFFLTLTRSLSQQQLNLSCSNKVERLQNSEKLAKILALQAILITNLMKMGHLC